MSDSSSDDSDDVKKLLDSVDTQFINDDMFTRKKNKDIPNEEATTHGVKKPKSLRYCEQSIKQSNILGVPPEVQKFIAKHLSKICDEQIEEVVPKKRKKMLQKERDDHPGIHLLRTSTDYIHLEENDDEKVKIFNSKNRYCSFKSKTRKIAEEQNRSSVSEEEDENKKAKVAAVTPDWVLNKEGIQGWVKTVKSEVIEGKQSSDCNRCDGGSVINREVKKKKKKKKISDSVTQAKQSTDCNKCDSENVVSREVKKKKKKMKKKVSDSETQDKQSTDCNSCDSGNIVNGEMKKKKKKKLQTVKHV